MLYARGEEKVQGSGALTFYRLRVNLNFPPVRVVCPNVLGGSPKCLVHRREVLHILQSTESVVVVLPAFTDCAFNGCNDKFQSLWFCVILMTFFPILSLRQGPLNEVLAGHRVSARKALRVCLSAEIPHLVSRLLSTLAPRDE